MSLIGSKHIVHIQIELIHCNTSSDIGIHWLVIGGNPLLQTVLPLYSHKHLTITSSWILEILVIQCASWNYANHHGFILTLKDIIGKFNCQKMFSWSPDLQQCSPIVMHYTNVWNLCWCSLQQFFAGEFCFISNCTGCGWSRSTRKRQEKTSCR